MSPGTDWREAFAGYLRRLRAVLRSHPNVLPAIATRPVTSAHMLATPDTVVARLTTEGFSGADAIDMINCMGTYTIGHALAEVGQPVGGESEDPHSIWSAMSPEEFPHLVAIFSDGYKYSADAQYELGLTAMLDGMAVRLATR
jgi:TetR/AcrR family transcriptional regulator, tetracycline repressor protein